MLSTKTSIKIALLVDHGMPEAAFRQLSAGTGVEIFYTPPVRQLLPPSVAGCRGAGVSHSQIPLTVARGSADAGISHCQKEATGGACSAEAGAAGAAGCSGPFDSQCHWEVSASGGSEVPTAAGLPCV